MKFDKLQALCDKYRLYKDRGVVRMVAAAVIANQLPGKKRKPVWIVFVAPPGGGKSDITGTLANVEKDGKKLCEEVSDLTTASLASGMRSADGETSLLHKVNKEGGILLFKDFTTLLSKRPEDLAAIMSYLREVYDGRFEKKFGNGKIVKWEGKVGIVASCTTIIYHKLGELAVMGDRLMMYQVEQPDRLNVLDKIWANEDAGVDGEEEMGECMKEYVEGVITYLQANPNIEEIKIDPETRKEFGEIANFVCFARSGVVWDYRRKTILYVPDPEMPTRVLRQLIAMASSFIAMNVAEGLPASLTDSDKALLYKLAFDSIPSMRRTVIKVVASYTYGATLAGVSSVIGMQDDATMAWLEELSAVKVLEKSINPATRKEAWSIRPDFLDIVKRYEGVTQKEEALVADSDGIAETNDDLGF